MVVETRTHLQLFSYRPNNSWNKKDQIHFALDTQTHDVVGCKENAFVSRTHNAVCCLYAAGVDPLFSSGEYLRLYWPALFLYTIPRCIPPLSQYIQTVLSAAFGSSKFSSIITDTSCRRLCRTRIVCVCVTGSVSVSSSCSLVRPLWGGGKIYILRRYERWAELQAHDRSYTITPAVQHFYFICQRGGGVEKVKKKKTVKWDTSSNYLPPSKPHSLHHHQNTHTKKRIWWKTFFFLRSLIKQFQLFVRVLPPTIHHAHNLLWFSSCKFKCRLPWYDDDRLYM